MNLRAHTGIAMRMMMRSYLQAIGFVIFALLVIALSIDLGKTLESLRAKADATDTPLWRLLLPYASYRATDIITRLLGTACVVGGFVAVLLRHLRREDVVLGAAGMSPRVHFSALLAVALVVGSVQFGFQNWLRPVAVKAQVETQLGRYGRWFGGSRLDSQWILDNDMALRTNIIRGDSGRLESLKIFEGLSEPTLSRLIEADSALPDPTTGLWDLQNVTLWTQDTDFAPVHSDSLTMALPLRATQLQWYDVHGYYLPNAVARDIVQLSGTAAASDAATVLAFRKAALLLPGIFVLLGASLAQAGIRGHRLNAPRLLSLAAAGYLSVVVVKSFLILGINGRIAPELSAALPLAIAFAIACLLQLRHAGYLFRASPVDRKQVS